MINNPTNSIPTPEEKAIQIRVLEKHLAELLSDVRELENKLESVRKESKTAQKERDYEQKQLTEMKAKVLEEEAKLLQSQQEFVSLTEANDRSRALLEKQTIEHDEKHRAFIAREKAIIEGEERLAARSEELDKHANKIAAQKVEVELAQKAFKKAADSITWK